MITKLTKLGDNLALVIDPSILELLHIDEETPLELSTDGQALVIVPSRDKKRGKTFEAALAECHNKFGNALKRLAD